MSVDEDYYDYVVSDGEILISNEATYTYDANGIRTSKTVNGIKHEYVLDGSRIVAEKWVENNVEYMMVFLYDDAGSPVGFLYRTSEYASNQYDAYFYEKNFFGDVTAIYNESGSCVARYAYNAWGEHTITYHNNGIAEMNPIRYRGYYYDTHTGLYYLQSRYYNPAWGRFISADNPSVLSLSPDALTDKNLYIYCDNNPVMRVDEEGDAWHILAGAVLGVVSRYVCDVVENVVDGKSGLDVLNPRSFWVDYVAAGASGALAASGVGLVGQIAGNATISLVQETTDQLFDDDPGVNLDAIALNTVGVAISGSRWIRSKFG